ncbi:MAG: pyridoxal-phosphate dependent enzyme [Ignavibacteria bacterium]|jgi:cysteine synthase|nr:pyridoxal-phosphate dependent enzyme [Ignavibacteria bacterium]MCU7502312.1 pyridoxal-phosphate dependent enzyme [Ignavibacteria bacterium]MCU7516644.1 pyridoxal-phosphate dependent enzyme [Ignavibacteria bacterium]
MINLEVNTKARKNNIQRCREKSIRIPTFKQMKNPASLSEQVKESLRQTGLKEINPVNLFRITWKNDPKENGGLFSGVNYLEFPEELTGVKARIVALPGKWFPIGAHKVGAAFGCLVPQLITGNFDSTWQKAVWPSTGNYCRGGVFNSALLGCSSLAILPEGMSRERFNWLMEIGAEVITTPGTESNVKEIFDKCNELRLQRQDVVIFNQFEEPGNYLWHYEVTGNAVLELFEQMRKKNSRLKPSAFVSSTGSAGTIASGDRLKEEYPNLKIAATEALQCPTLLQNGFGSHRIEGIGDKHVPWIHNVRNTDLIVDIDDNACLSLFRLFNEPLGREFLIQEAIPADVVLKLHLCGISGIANLLSAIKLARYYELTENDVIFTVLTDSADMYNSRLQELRTEEGDYTERDAAKAFGHYLMPSKDISSLKELNYYDRKRIHNLKYFTWIEQQGKSVEELNSQWYEAEYWAGIRSQAGEIDRLIEEFNKEVECV